MNFDLARGTMLAAVSVLGVLTITSGGSAAQTVTPGSQPYGHLAVACAPTNTIVESVDGKTISHGISLGIPYSCNLTNPTTVRDWLVGLLPFPDRGSDEVGAKIESLLRGDISQIGFRVQWASNRWGAQDDEEVWTVKGYRKIIFSIGEVMVIDIERSARLIFGTTPTGSKELIQRISLPIVDISGKKTVLLMAVANEFPDSNKRFSYNSHNWQANSFTIPQTGR